MARLIVVIGLPGSGKTEYLRRCLASIAEEDRIDDFMKESIEHSASFGRSRHYSRLIRALGCGRDCAIADIAYCDPVRRAEIVPTVLSEIGDIIFEWHCFENDPTRCTANVRLRALSERGRDANRETQRIADLSGKYEIPAEAKIVRVWAGS